MAREGSHRVRNAHVILWALVLFASSPALAVHTLPSGFDDPAVFSGLNHPMTVRFASDGRIFVAEKRGVIKVFQGLGDTTPDTFVDFSTNVHDFWDRGFLGMTLDPDFPNTPYVYVLYTYDFDLNTPSIPAPRWGDVCNGSPTGPGATTDGCVVSGRLSRYQVSSTNTVIGGETVLIENNWCQQYPSHSLGALNFGPDGALYVEAGDGASFEFEDYGQAGGTIGNFTPKNPCGDPTVPRGGTQTLPSAQGGALRAQDLRTSGDPATLDGAVLRVNPTTGAAMSDNPLIGGDPTDDRIIAYGLRNPFRSTFRPGTSELWIGDVGWDTWEEINRLTAPLGTVENFGWPCYEGAPRQPGYDGKNLTVCENLYSAGTGAVVSPYYAYSHSSHVDPAGDACPTGGSSTTGLAFYVGGGAYPSTYDDALFFADFSRRCIYVMRKGANGLPDPATRTAFVVDAFTPVDLQRGPGGDIYYVDHDGGTIRRIRFTSGNTPPTALAQASPSNGPTPLTVQFDGTGSTDPDPGATLFYAWDLDGDGSYDDSTIARPVRVYGSSGNVTVGLRVTDDDGASDTDAIVVSPGNTAPTATVLSPASTLTWRVGDAISYSGRGDDPNEGLLPASRLHWDILLHHCDDGGQNCHVHTVEQHDGIAGGTFSAPGHDWYAYLEFQLTVRDSGNLTDTKSVSVNPVAVTNAYESTPSGLSLTVAGAASTTPFTRPCIVGTVNSVSAPTTQSLGPTSYYWTSWSDGGAQSHEFIAGDTPVTRTATYAPCGTVDLCDGLDNNCDGITDNAPVPGAMGSLSVSRTQMSWSPRPEATRYDVLQGSLATLHAGHGNFTTATAQCLANDLAATSLAYAAAPAPGDGSWFLVRGVNCVGTGSYDEASASQSGSRDAGIQGSASACPGVLTTDTTLPSVSITAPNVGAIVSGTAVPVTADASDDVGVAGVQFLLDGSPLAAEDTSSPYAVSWNSTTAVDGAHTLAARAHDAAGNTKTSAGVNVTVSNGAPVGLVGAWSFNAGSGTTAVDSSGQGNNGTVSNTTWTASGKYGSALVFNGTNAWVTVNDANSLDLTTGMTIEAWVYPTTTLSWWVCVAHKDVDRWYLMANSNVGPPVGGGTFGSGNLNTYAPATIPANVWTHLATTYDGTALRVFVNGTQVSSQPQTTPLTTSTSALHIGGDFYGEWFTGRVDEVRIYNRGLSAAEIQADMTHPLP